MDKLGTPVAYLALPVGVPVYDRDGTRIGTVEHVLADEGSDIFHGLVVRVVDAPDRSMFAARDQIGDLFEHGVTLTVTEAGLHDPGEDRVAAAATDGSVGEQAKEGLRRAWEWLQRPG
ncbi:hypothetical protein GCM10010399_87740 [Dactylosporangium fulvum]|uniref:PRC-barrel domain-containing protein n=1 Tax=Dactylosporangium fulvum TaxID=53359 RepID=A0ABY5W9V2_9ACTN|nr:PRC-barrel domain-containing protein [Dactylosporangium fulvum]UWP86337.1 PRC-barrel domain-containing protein [Dactylosporangium fulvum]